MIYNTINTLRLRAWLLPVLFVLCGTASFAAAKIYPDKPNPPRLVNDFAGILSSGDEDRLEHKLESFARTTSTQITVVTMRNLGGHEVADYTVHVFNEWGIGQSGKNNGVLVLVSLEDRKAWITTGKGLEGVLTDAKTSQIFRNELRPAFKAGDYYTGLDQTAEAIIAVTKDEYTADKHGNRSGTPRTAIIVIIIIIVLLLKISGRGGGGGGGYMSRRGMGDVATGFLLSSLLNGGNRGGGWGGSGGGGFGGGGGGFGGFGGGSSGGGGAGGSW